LISPKESKREVVHENRCRHLINLSPRGQHHTKLSESAALFAYNTYKLHKEISTPIQKRNANYEAYVNLYKRVQEFNIED